MKSNGQSWFVLFAKIYLDLWELQYMKTVWFGMVWDYLHSLIITVFLFGYSHHSSIFVNEILRNPRISSIFVRILLWILWNPRISLISVVFHQKSSISVTKCELRLWFFPRFRGQQWSEFTWFFIRFILYNCQFVSLDLYLYLVPYICLKRHSQFII